MKYTTARGEETGRHRRAIGRRGAGCGGVRRGGAGGGFMFLGVVLGVASCALLGGSKTVLEPNMAPTWADFGAILVTFWTIFGCSFGIST